MNGGCIDYLASAKKLGELAHHQNFFEHPQLQVLNIHIDNFIDVACGRMMDFGDLDPFLRESERFFCKHHCFVIVQ